MAKKSRRRLLPLVLLAGMAGASMALAATPNYFTRTWQMEQGLPQNKVTAVVQTRDGYLWLGTYYGLARFDGVRFTTFDENNTPQLHSSRVTSLFESDEGVLWIGMESGEVAKYQGGVFTSVPVLAQWRGGKIVAITEDDAGEIWLFNETGELVRVRDGKTLSPPSGAVAGIVSLTRALDGTIWIVREGAVSALKQGKLAAVALPGFSKWDYVQGFCAARDGGTWVALNGGIRKWKEGTWTVDLKDAPWGWGIVSNLLETSAGVLVGGTPDAGLWMIFPNQPNAPPLHLDRTRGLPSDWVISLCEDREQNLWCGTGSGLALVRRSNLEVLSPPNNWKGRALLSVLPTPDGSIWVGTEGAGLYRLQGGVWTNFDGAEGIRNSYIWSLAADPSGRIWAGTWGGGLFVQKNGAFDFAPGLETLREPIPALFFSGEELWIGTPSGALRWRDGKLTRFREIGGEPFGDVRAIARDKSGVLWFGTAGRGLVRLDNGELRRFTKADGLSSDFVECLQFTDDGTLWIGSYGGGLNRLAGGRFSTINWRQGLPNGVIGHIEKDDSGRLWMSSYGGIISASERDLNLCADGVAAEAPFVTYGISDGMPTPEGAEGSQSAGGKSADGRLWFPTARGLVVVDPANVMENPLPPPVKIEEVWVDGKKAWDGHSTQPLVIGPGRHRIEFAYTGLSFVAPEKVRFKYQLVNFDPGWIQSGTRRTATYNSLPPGDYTFKVLACNNDGVWNETGASLACEVRPHFWQTIWFLALAGAAAVLLAGGGVWFETRRRMRRKLRDAERERDVERERSRIARDIHDDLGAQLTRITMISDSARGEMARPERVVSGLEKIYDTARELTRRIDEIVWAVNPRHDTLESLAAYLEKYAQDWLSAMDFRCRLDLPLQFPDWHLTSEVRHNVFLALKEALNNAVKHSGSREVFIRMAIMQNSFELTVEDDGRGFSTETERGTGGNGLNNMRQRMAEIGGRCRIESTPGGGARIVLTMAATPERHQI